ncbi:YkgJ family cysteine cluster protein [Alkanindiges sp. WGS2144]|uniref:YkgJ family cysteine cluster protein n=1 Tax=Alkanindiges sp. WGS2144 TaxID=3366808 RepID=UPI003753805B
MMSDSTVSNPCLTCGACCAHFRVSFYWAESEAKGLPVALTEQVNHFFSCMRGTNQAKPRCQCLEGELGQQVSCSIYAQRPEACKEVQAGDDKCNRARLRHGFVPLNRIALINIAPVPEAS